MDTGSNCVRISIVYRPPSGSASEFCDEFMHYIDGHTTTTGQLMIMGDFKFHFENSEDNNSQRFSNLLFSLNLDQSVHQPTHDRGHMLDLVLSRQEEPVISNLSVCPYNLSDHHIISFNISCKQQTSVRKLTKVRKIKDIDIEKLSSDIINSDLLRNPPTELNDLVECYDSTISDIFEQHAPVQEKEIVLRPHAPWYTDSIRLAKHAWRRAERKWMKTQLTVDREWIERETN